MFYFLSFLWFLRETRANLFWLYLWQLKEYHLARFIDHFRTERGRKLLFGPLVISKIIILVYAYFISLPTKLLPWQLYAVWAIILMLLYLLEAFKFFQDFFQKTLKKPVLTPKTLSLILLALIFEILFLFILFKNFYFVLFQNFYWFTFYLLLFDILTPLIVSIIVFLIHFLTVIFFRNKIIKKAKEKRGQFKNLLVIGIAGSYGKTSTKEFLAEILSEKFKVLKTKENQNSEVGISQCILNDLTEKHQIFICEMGAYSRGGIKLLCDIAKPKIGILTGINEQHMATFGSQESIIKTKYELIESLPDYNPPTTSSHSSLRLEWAPDGLAFFNAKNKYCLELYQQTKIKKYLYGETASFFGEENLLGAMAVAKELGMIEKEIALVVKKIKNEIPGIQLKKRVNGLTIIDATYSANPDGVIGHLEYLKMLSGKKIIIMPCLIELGKASIDVHKRIGEKIGEICDLAIIVTKERFQEIKKGAVEKGMKEKNFFYLEKPKAILEKIKPLLKSGNAVLLEGRVPNKIIDILLK